MNNQKVGAAGTIGTGRRKGVRIFAWIAAPIVGALLLATLPRTIGLLSARNNAANASNSNALISLVNAKFVEVPGTGETRAWTDGVTVLHTRNGKLVDAFLVGTNTHAWVPQAGTRLYCSNGEFSGFVVPKTSQTTELQRFDDSSVANMNVSSVSLR